MGTLAIPAAQDRVLQTTCRAKRAGIPDKLGHAAVLPHFAIVSAVTLKLDGARVSTGIRGYTIGRAIAGNAAGLFTDSTGGSLQTRNAHPSTKAAFTWQIAGTGFKTTTTVIRIRPDVHTASDSTVDQGREAFWSDAPLVRTGPVWITYILAGCAIGQSTHLSLTTVIPPLIAVLPTFITIKLAQPVYAGWLF